MSFTATTTMHVEEFPPPPPTNNTLEPEERSRLLRSTRKLGAILGTTPLLVEPKSEAESSTATPPRTRAARREGRLFHSPSSSVSSSETLAISPEPDYVFVRPTTRSAPYQVQAVFNNASPPTSRSASPQRNPTSGMGASASAPAARNLKRKQGQEGALAPITIMFPLPAPGGSKSTRSGAPKDKSDKGKASQPLLLRSRPAPVPVNSNNDMSIKPDVHSNSPPKPLSPVSSTFNMSIVPPSPTFPSSRDSSSQGLSDREKRRKMAKLTRTLGENIPPELVFRAPTFGSNTSSSNPTASSSNSSSQVSRRSSLSISRHTPRPSVASVFDSFHKPTKFSLAPKFNPAASLPPLAVAENATPIPTQPEEDSSETQTKRRNRPRSLTLGTSSAIASATAALLLRERETARGTTSLDIQPRTRTELMPTTRHTHQPQPSPKPFVGMAQVQAQARSQITEEGESHHQGGKLSVEFGRRKEREWSGEWNRKDMEDVAKKLRGLKGR